MKKILFVWLCLFSFNSFAGHTPDPQVVSQVDFNRYAGLWYEVARSPNFFQRNCKSSTAEYKLIDEKTVSVFNTCFKFNGRKSTISGFATVVDPSVPSKLRVRFNWFARGDYWITELDPNYQWAVVSGPAKKFNFILSRVAPAPESLKNDILKTLKEKGFDTSSLIFDQYE